MPYNRSEGTQIFSPSRASRALAFYARLALGCCKSCSRIGRIFDLVLVRVRIWYAFRGLWQERMRYHTFHTHGVLPSYVHILYETQPSPLSSALYCIVGMQICPNSSCRQYKPSLPLCESKWMNVVLIKWSGNGVQGQRSRLMPVIPLYVLGSYCCDNQVWVGRAGKGRCATSSRNAHLATSLPVSQSLNQSCPKTVNPP